MLEELKFRVLTQVPGTCVVVFGFFLDEIIPRTQRIVAVVVGFYEDRMMDLHPQVVGRRGKKF